MNKTRFPKGFKWGVATAALQVDGGAFEGGKGLTNWDVYPETDVRVYQKQNASVACDHYHRYKEDFEYLTQLGVQTYRFSFCWARILPNGKGKINKEGLKFYDSLLAELKKRNIEICATIFHWDYPDALVKEGGWLNLGSPKWFLEYTKILVDRYKDIIDLWIPINEPSNVASFGGVEYNRVYTTKEKLQICHNILLAHGYAAKYLKDNNQKVGTAMCSTLYAPYSDSPEDIEAARIANFDIQRNNIWGTALWSDPVVFGKYPDKYFEIYLEEERPNITDEDMKIISTPLDFYGHNAYTGYPVKSDGKGGYEVVNHEIGTAKSTMDWDFYPKILYWIPKYLYERYKLPLYITENGTSVTDIVTSDKKVHDGPRIEYLNQYLLAYAKAIEDGVDARGYYLWSFFDNFEWFSGYQRRFGIIYIDFITQERIKKDSFEFYKEVIATNGDNLK